MIPVVAQLSGSGGLAGRLHKETTGGFWDGIRKALAEVERHHKRNEWVARSGGRLATQATDPDKLTVRTGSLKRSYTRRLIKSALSGSYGSDLVYAPVHEFGSSTKNIPARPGLQRTVDATASRVEKIIADATEKGIADGR